MMRCFTCPRDNHLFSIGHLVKLFPRSQIDIFLRVVQSDGGLLPACINAANLALMDAGQFFPRIDALFVSYTALYMLFGM
jgi:exosome complex component RRP41